MLLSLAGEVGLIGAGGEGTFLPSEADGEFCILIDGAGAGDEGFKGEFGGFALTGLEGVVEVVTEAPGEIFHFPDGCGQGGLFPAPEVAVEVDEGGAHFSFGTRVREFVRVIRDKRAGGCLATAGVCGRSGCRAGRRDGAWREGVIIVKLPQEFLAEGRWDGVGES